MSGRYRTPRCVGAACAISIVLFTPPDTPHSRIVSAKILLLALSSELRRRAYRPNVGRESALSLAAPRARSAAPGCSPDKADAAASAAAPPARRQAPARR